MKRVAMLCGALIAASSVAIAQNLTGGVFSSEDAYMTARIAKAAPNYAAALDATNDGVVESTLGHVIRMRLMRPNDEFPKIQKAIRRLIFEGRTPAIRYKAYLAQAVFSDTEELRTDECLQCQTPDELFTAVSRHVQAVALASAR